MQELTLICVILLTSSVAYADDTTTIETCADGAGTVISGVVSGHKYCKSNNGMNWYNAYAWCDALNKRLFVFNDCMKLESDTVICPDLAGANVDGSWTGMISSTEGAYYSVFQWNDFWGNYRNSQNGHYYFALCY